MRPLLLMVFVAAGVGAGACSGTHEPRSGTPRAVAAAPARYPAGVNVPGLLSLSVDELSQRVGPRRPVPAGFFDPVLLPLLQRRQQLDSAVLFQAKGLAMVAAYNYRSRQVTDLLLLGDNENELMSRAQLELGAEKYLVLPVFQSQRPTQLLGLRVLAIAPNP